MLEWKKWWTQGEVYCPRFRFSLKGLTTGDNTTKFARLCFWAMLSAKTNISVLQSQLDRLSAWHHLTAHYRNKSLKYAWLAWHARKRGKFIRVQNLVTNKKEMPESKAGHIYSICWVNRKYPPPPDSTILLYALSALEFPYSSPPHPCIGRPFVSKRLSFLPPKLDDSYVAASRSLSRIPAQDIQNRKSVSRVLEIKSLYLIQTRSLPVNK